MEIKTEYHEEHDDEGRKVFAYLGNKEYMRRSFRYEYDDEGNLKSKTFIDYGFGQRNSTTYYTPSGEIKEVYTQTDEEIKEIMNNKDKCIEVNMSKKNRKLYEIYYQCDKLRRRDLSQKTFHKELSKAYRYNENGMIAEEFNKDEQNITYKYDAYGNLIEKRRGDKILLKQKFKVCE